MIRVLLAPLAGAWLLAGTCLAADVSGPLTKWETVTIDFKGPEANESAGELNAFLDYRLQVELTGPQGTKYVVPGFFDGDGKGGGTGNVWRVRFTPDEVGKWTFRASFRQAPGIAVESAVDLGEPVSSIDGEKGKFTIAEKKADAEGHFATGRLEYVGESYLKSRDGGYWLKSGTNSPENLLAYKGFDNTQAAGTRKKGVLHEFNDHLQDWRNGDPDWDSPDYSFADEQDGRRMIGALNYLADQHVNSVYVILMSIGGDGQDVHPYANIKSPTQLSGNAANDNLRFDISKLAQWETVFRHAQRRGIHLHLVLSEGEATNKRELDDGALGVERKLLLREMVARFGHHNAVQWNLCEEFDLGDGLGANTADKAACIVECAAYVSSLDAYQHPVSVHHADCTRLSTDASQSVWQHFLGNGNFDTASLQAASEVEKWSCIVEGVREAAASSKRPLAVMVDEPASLDRIDLGPAEHGNDAADAARRHLLWDVYLSGAAGLEWYVDGRDQSIENFGETFKTENSELAFGKLWQQTWIARQFVEQHLPYWQMVANDDLVRGSDAAYGGAEGFAKPGEVYAIYLPEGSCDDNPATGGKFGPGPNGPPELDLTAYAEQRFTLRWFNPRTGEFATETLELVGGGWTGIGPTPDGVGSTTDWVALIEQVQPAITSAAADSSDSDS